MSSRLLSSLVQAMRKELQLKTADCHRFIRNVNSSADQNDSDGGSSSSGSTTGSHSSKSVKFIDENTLERFQRKKQIKQDIILDTILSEDELDSEDSSGKYKIYIIVLNTLEICIHVQQRYFFQSGARTDTAWSSKKVYRIAKKMRAPFYNLLFTIFYDFEMMTCSIYSEPYNYTHTMPPIVLSKWLSFSSLYYRFRWSTHQEYSSISSSLPILSFNYSSSIPFKCRRGSSTALCFMERYESLDYNNCTRIFVSHTHWQIFKQHVLTNGICNSL